MLSQLHLSLYECIYLFLLSLALTMAGPRVSISISAAPSLSWILKKEERSTITSSVGGYVFVCTDQKRRRRLKSLHSAVEGAERAAFSLVKNLLLQQNLHTRIVTCTQENINHISLYHKVLTIRALLKHLSSSICVRIEP